MGLRLPVTAMSRNHFPMSEEITFIVEKDEGSEMLIASWDDQSGNGGITTQGADLKELQEMVSEAVRCHFDERELRLSRGDRRVTIPNHKAIAPKTLQSILRQADVNVAVLRDLL